MAAYYQWRLWNAVGWARYKGGGILEKATGLSPVARDDDDDDDDEEEEEEKEEEEMTVAMAAVRVE